MRISRISALLFCSLIAITSGQARAFTHVVQRGDTLASIAERVYGTIQHEKLLVTANALEAQGGTSIVPGMRLEVPALAHRRVKRGDTWPALATELLGSAHRADVLAAANGTSPWLTPEEGSEIVVPYNLRVIATPADTIVTIAYKYLGDRNKAWVLDHYNGLKGRQLQRGDVVLVPLLDLKLTPDGQRAARVAAGLSRSEGAGSTRETQLRVRDELPALVADIKSGRYIDAVTRGNRFLASGQLSKPTLARVHRQMLEAYVALGAMGLATAACSAWRKADPSARLDPVLTSPKIIAACARGSPAPAKE
jgi:LysM repeat protein